MIRVCVVDDQTLVRQGIRSLLQLADGIEVVAEAADGEEALAVIDATSPDVLLLDLRMPVLDGIATLRRLAEQANLLPTLVLTTFDDDAMLLSALRVGARGYLLKDVTLEQLVDAIHVLAAGGTLFQPTVTAKLLERLADHPLTFDRVALPEPLKPRELEILRLLAGGYSNREIAGATHVAEGTVKNHVSNVLWKLGVRDRTRAVLRGLELGLIPGVLRPRPGRPGGA
ncbi:MAG: response regulator transcription factor [Actinomycetota bacterium]|nr:response regulator transcription factor [Actinomycetota bacterium]